MVSEMLSQLSDDIEKRWISCHLYYHQDHDRPLHDFVGPLVASLVANHQIDAFFFVRYGLGGPHIRLRLRALPGTTEQIMEEVQQSARHFLRVRPSTCSLDEQVIRRANEHILSNDPHETDDSVYPDNTLVFAPFRPEVARFGGQALLPFSLTFFTLSSVVSLISLFSHLDDRRSLRLAAVLQLLLYQALGFAADEAELRSLLNYGVDSWGQSAPQLLENGDRVFQSQAAALLKLFTIAASALRSLLPSEEPIAEAPSFLAVAAARLSAGIGKDNPSIRLRIGTSQLHLTATRLGLSNAEEVYISRLLYATLQELLSAGSDISSLLPLVVTSTESSLAGLLKPALASLEHTYRPK
jgi:hypothetical protein